MANVKISALTADTSPTSDDLIPTVTDPAGTPASRKVTLGNAITKAHGLSDGVPYVASSVMANIGNNSTAIPKVLTQTSSNTPVWAELPSNATMTFMFSATNSDIGGYESAPALSAFTAGASTSITTGLTTTPALMATFATNVGYPNTTTIPVGIIHVHYETTKAAGSNNYYTYAEIYKRTSGGTETLIATSDNSAQTALNTLQQVTVGASVAAAVALNLTDRIVVKIYGVMTSSTANVDLTYDNNTDARVELPVASVDATSYLPYTGATRDVDTGTNGITTNDLTISGSTASRILSTDASKVATALDTATYPNLTELSYVKGVTSAIQTQLDAKQASGATLTSLEGLTLGAGDMLYATAADTLTDLAIGSPSQQLRVNAGGTAPEWFTPSSSGGQTLVDIVVAASGGDYTTLGAALTAATSGQTIFVRSGTYSESAISIATTNLTIIGENRETTIISMGANNLTLSGSGLHLQNIKISSTTGSQTYSSAKKCVHNCWFYSEGGSQTMRFTSGVNCSYVGNIFENQATTGFKKIEWVTETGSYVMSNQFVLNKNSSSSLYGAVSFNIDDGAIVGNRFVLAGVATAANPAVSLISSKGLTFSNNHITYSATVGGGLLLEAGAMIYQVTDNTFYPIGYKAIYAQNEAIIKGNYAYMNVGSGDYGVYADSGGLIIVGNRLYSGHTNATSAGIYLTSNAANCVINDNNIFRFGKSVDISNSACVRILVKGNILRDSTTPVNDSGVGTNVEGNVIAGAADNYTAEKKFVSVTNTSGSTIAIGDLVVYKAVANGYEVTTTTTAGDDKVFGVSATSTSTGNVATVQVLGKCTTLKVDGTTDIAIGDFLTSFTTAGIAAKAAAGDMCIAIALEAYTANDSLGVIDCMIISPRLI